MIEEAIFTDNVEEQAPKIAPTLEQRMEACASTIRTAFETNDMDLLKYALSKYHVHLRIVPAEIESDEPTPPTHQSSTTDALVADPEE